MKQYHIHNTFLSLLLILAAVTGGCAKNDQTAAKEKLSIVTTTGMIADAASIIGGDNIQVTALMGPGVDPHLYKATKGDVDQLETADLILYNGLHLEGKMVDVFENMSKSKPTVAVAAVILDSELRHPTEFQGHPDPHVWFDVSLWRMAVGAVAFEIAQLDSVNRPLYHERATVYLDSLTQLHQWVQEQMATIPEDQRILVTAHDAFGYFGRAYNIEVRGLQGISTVTEAGLYDVTAMVDLLVSQKIKAVFVESSVPKKTIEAVVEGCTSRGHKVIIGGELFSDAMGQSGTPEGTYLGMVRHNVNTIVAALR
ncbi:MAG: zinc ABC transporter substrate-binding protein [candidate division Zixibacteria bacterium]|nr:zinc ABC transporter substrate-binding protein [candidate division Zixibacteria bacterium]